MLQTVAGPPAWEEVERWGSPRNILKKEQGKEQDEEVGPSQNFRVRRDSEDCVGSKLTCSLPSIPPPLPASLLPTPKHLAISPHGHRPQKEEALPGSLEHIQPRAATEDFFSKNSAKILQKPDTTTMYQTVILRMLLTRLVRLVGRIPAFLRLLDLEALPVRSLPVLSTFTRNLAAREQIVPCYSPLLLRRMIRRSMGAGKGEETGGAE